MPIYSFLEIISFQNICWADPTGVWSFGYKIHFVASKGGGEGGFSLGLWGE